MTKDIEGKVREILDKLRNSGNPHDSTTNEYYERELEIRNLALSSILSLTTKAGKFVVWKDGTWIYLKDGISWEFEQDKNWLLTIDLSKDKTFMDYKDYPNNKEAVC